MNIIIKHSITEFLIIMVFMIMSDTLENERVLPDNVSMKQSESVIYMLMLSDDHTICLNIAADTVL